MTVNTCRTCKHWDCPPLWDAEGYRHYDADEYIYPTDPDTYEPMETTFSVGKCNHPELLFCERPLTSDGFMVADGSTYMANLYTAEDFGCVRHEAADV